MKNKNLFIAIKSVMLLILVIEIFLNIIFNYNDKKRVKNRAQFIASTKSYGEVSPTVVNEIFEELYNLDTQWEPFTHFRLKEFNGEHNTIDSIGHRKTLNSNLINTTDPLKIFCFGGSTMYSTGARDSHTIPSELSKLIYKEHPNLNIEITNFGCHGYNRSIENVQLQQELLKNNIPDIVIFYDGVNEIIGAHQNNKAGTPTNAINRKNEFKLGHSYSKKIKLFLNSSGLSRFVLYLQRRIFKTKSFETESVQKLSKDIANNYIQNLKISKSFSREYNFKVLNFLQPVIYSKEKHSEYELVMANKHKYLEKLYLNSYSLIQQNKMLVSDTTFIDISTVFNTTSKTIYTDFCHTAEKGNTIVANEIFKHLYINQPTSN